MGCPLPPYIKEKAGERRPARRRRARRSPTPTGSRTPFFPSWRRRRGEGGGREEGKGGATPLLVQFGLEGEGACGLPWPPLLFSTKAHVGPLNPRGGSGNPRYSGIYPITPGTIPVSEYSRPIYQSSCLDHFETPRHVRDHIRDSELSSVHQNT